MNKKEAFLAGLVIGIYLPFFIWWVLWWFFRIDILC